MKIGITYLYTISAYGYPPAVEDDFRALAEIERMGFHYLEMEALGPEHAQQVWDRRDEFRRRLDAHHIKVHNFCAVDPALAALDAQTRKAALERFKRTVELGAFLGAETIHLASYAPPVAYASGTPYALGEAYEIKDKVRVKIPDGFSWARIWDALVDSCRQAAVITAQEGRTVIMEPRVGETICSVDSMIRLIRDVNEPNFKANFDTGHFAAQRECVPLALKKLEGMFANVHISDNDPVNAEHVTLGQGSIDWPEFFRVLSGMGYTGYLGLDLGASPTLKDDLAASAAYIEKLAAAQGFSAER